VISANSFCIRLAEVLRALDIFGLGLLSLVSLTGVGVVVELAVVCAAAWGGGDGEEDPLASVVVGLPLLLLLLLEPC